MKGMLDYTQDGEEKSEEQAAPEGKVTPAHVAKARHYLLMAMDCLMGRGDKSDADGDTDY